MIEALIRWSCRCRKQTWLHRPMYLSQRRLDNRLLCRRLCCLYKERKNHLVCLQATERKNLAFAKEGEVTKYLSIKMNHHRDRPTQLSQP